MYTKLPQTFTVAVALGMLNCSANDAGLSEVPIALGGATGVQHTGSTPTGGKSALATGGQSTLRNTGGTINRATGGAAATGGKPATGGAHATGGNSATGGAATGGRATGGAASGGRATGGAAMGGRATGGGFGFGFGGFVMGSGGAGSGGAASVGGVGGGGRATGGAANTGTSALDCNAPMPSGGTQHSGNGRGGSGNLAWEIWSNQGSGTMKTFSTPAFSASWNNSGDYLGRLGFEWGNSGKAYTAYGTITADFTFKKTGSGGSYSYIGIYGWSTNPCVEWYIIDDSFGTMPFTPWNSSAKGSATMIDGENYKFYSNSTNGTGGSRCNASSWTQHWSVRQKARQCGRITISDHFKAWAAAGMSLGNMLEAKILVETGGGSGTVDFPIANVATTQ